MTMPSACRLPFLLLLAGLVGTAGVSAQSGANILLVVNEASPDGVSLAAHYARVRGVPPDQIVRLKLETTDGVDRAVFDAQIHASIVCWMSRHAAQDRILYPVLTKGVPLAVDGRIPNPHFLENAPIGQARPFSRSASVLYLVTRLDGFTAGDAAGLIDRGSAPRRDGRVLLDQKAGVIDASGNAWLAAAAARPMEAVVLNAPANADIRLHAAVIFAGVGCLDDARAQLDEALRLDPALGSNDEVLALGIRLK
jgi:hypothetical protein